MKTGRIILVLLALGFLGGLFVYFFVVNKPHTNIAKAETVYEGTAEGLYAEFQADKNTANTLYIDKVVQISGIITDIGMGSENITVQLEAGNPMGGGLSAAMALSEAEAVRQLSVGQSVILRGQCSGYDQDEGGLLGAFGGSLQLTSCLLVY